ncbi:MAG TPA: metalloregulator ArsR/SmtB family transcription factor [Humisphaera sp.]
MAVKSKVAAKPELGEAQLRAVAELFGVLSEPTRLRVLQVLQRGPATVGEVTAAAGLKQANASKQLGLLYKAGVLARAQEGNAVRYSIRMPLVNRLCALVCEGLREEAIERAKAFG